VRPILLTAAVLMMFSQIAAAQKVISPTPSAPPPPPPPSPPLDQPIHQTDQQQSSPANQGTDQVPFVVKELPRERSEEEKADAKEKAALDRRLTKYTGNLAGYTKALFVATLILAVMTGALALAAFRQMRDSRKSILAAEAAAKAARDNARGTLETVRVLRNAQRPYLSPFNPVLRDYGQTIGAPDASVVPIYVQLDITNVGPGIGFVRSYAVTHEICTRGSQGGNSLRDNDYMGLLPMQPHEKWILPGEVTSYPFRIKNDERDDIVKKRRVLYIYGNTRYWDIFHKNRRTGFIFECIPETGVLVMCPHPLWYDEEEPNTQADGTETAHAAPRSLAGETE
jgi:hypothetical protein